jgi:hypothetical protein
MSSSWWSWRLAISATMPVSCDRSPCTWNLVLNRMLAVAFLLLVVIVVSLMGSLLVLASADALLEALCCCDPDARGADERAGAEEEGPGQVQGDGDDMHAERWEIMGSRERMHASWLAICRSHCTCVLMAISP